MTRSRLVLHLAFAITLLVGANALADDWPQYGGIRRDGISRETGLFRTWPAEGPPLLWKISDLGAGFSPVSAVGSRLYTLAYRDKEEFVVALDRGTGKELWAVSLGVARESPVMAFLRQRQPLVDGSRLYAFSTAGRLVCLDVDQGKELWHKRYLEDLEGRHSPFGWTDYPLVDEGRLICTPGGKDRFHVALDKVTGEEIWKSSLGQKSYPSHSPMLPAEIGGVRMYIQNLSGGLVGIAAADGKLLWQYTKASSSTANMATPFVRGDQVFVVSGYNTGAALLRLQRKDDAFEVEEVRFDKKFQNLYGGIVALGDHVYAGHAATYAMASPTCYDWRNGKIAWQQKGPGQGALATIAADGCLYFRFADGLVVLAEATPDGFKEKGRLLPPDRTKSPAWSVPVIADGRLFLRDQQHLCCYDLRANGPKLKPLAPADDKTSVRQPDAVFIPSPTFVVDRMLELANVGKDDVVYDLGCGDGRIVVAAAKKCGARGVGVELDGALVRQARDEARRQGVEDRVEIREEDMFRSEIKDATVVMLYLLPHLNARLLPKLAALKPGTRIVAHGSTIPGVVPDRVVRVPSPDGIQEHMVYVWTTPLRTDLPHTAEWPMLGGTSSRNMVQPFEAGLPTSWVNDDDKIDGLKWKAALGSRSYGGPVVAGGRVFVGTNNQIPRNKADVLPNGASVDLSVLMCFRESDGKFLWQATHPKLKSGRANDWPREGLASAPTVEGDRLYYVSNRCELLCADVRDGKAVWRLDMMKELGVFPHYMSACSPLIEGDLVFAVTANGVDDTHQNIPAPKAPSFIAVDKRTGKVVWQDNSPTIAWERTDRTFTQLVDEGRLVQEGQWSNPTFAVAGGQRQVIFPGGDGWLRAFVPETGRLLWKFDCNPKAARFDLGGKGTRSPFIATPVVHEGRLYIGVGQNPENNEGVGHLWCIDLAKAVAKGAQNRDVSPRDDDFDPGAAVNRDSALAWHHGGLDAEALAKQNKRMPLFGRTMSTCAVHRGLVYAADLGGWLHCLDAASGKLLWKHDTGAQIWTSPLCADGKVYLGDDNGRVTVLAQGTEKRILAENEMTEMVRVGAVPANGVLYVVSGATLYALRRP